MRYPLIVMLAVIVLMAGCVTTVTAPGVSSPISVSIPSPASTRPDNSLLSEELEKSLQNPPFGTAEDGWMGAKQWFSSCCREAKIYEKKPDEEWVLFVFDAATREVRGAMITTKPRPSFESTETDEVSLVVTVEGDGVDKVLWRHLDYTRGEAEESVIWVQGNIPKAAAAIRRKE